MIKVTLYLEDDLVECLRAEATITLDTVVDIGDGDWGVVGKIIGVCLEPLPHTPPSLFTYGEDV